MPTAQTDYAGAYAAVDANASARQSIMDSVRSRVRAILAAFTQWYDDLAVRRMAREVASVVSAGQRALVSQEAAYLSWVLSDLSGSSVRPAPIVNPPAGFRSGTDPVATYERLGEEYRYQVSTGKEPADALRLVEQRADTMRATDLALAARAQDAQSFRSVTSMVKGYRRVIHPERSKGCTCGLCIAATDRVYKTGDLMPLHDNCHCTVLPVMRDGRDPGDSLNGLDLKEIYRAAGGTGADKLKSVRYKTVDHDQLGPRLVPVKVVRHRDGTGDGKEDSRSALQRYVDMGAPARAVLLVKLRKSEDTMRKNGLKEALAKVRERISLIEQANIADKRSA